MLMCITFQGCQSTDSITKTDVISEAENQAQSLKTPSKVAENGVCMADTLSFLVGQPETALEAMEYPENTRILVQGQSIDSVIDPTRLNLVLGFDRTIKFVYCG